MFWFVEAYPSKNRDFKSSLQMRMGIAWWSTALEVYLCQWKDENEARLCWSDCSLYCYCFLVLSLVFIFEQKREQVFECPIYQLPGPPLRLWHRYGPWIAMKWRRSAPTWWTTSSFPWLSGIRPFANCSTKNRTAGYYRFLAGLS